MARAIAVLAMRDSATAVTTVDGVGHPMTPSSGTLLSRCAVACPMRRLSRSETAALTPTTVFVELIVRPAIGRGLPTTPPSGPLSMLTAAVPPRRSRKSFLAATAMPSPTVSAAPTAVNAGGVGSLRTLKSGPASQPPVAAKTGGAWATELAL